MAKVQNTLINIRVARYRDTDLLVATSPEMQGLIVHGRSARELDERIPVAIRAILEAGGSSVIDVRPADDMDRRVNGFEPEHRRFEAVAALAA